MSETDYPEPVLKARNASEAVGVFLQCYCFFTSTRNSQIIDMIKLYVRALIEQQQEVAFEFDLRANTAGRNEDEGREIYDLRSPLPVVKMLEAMFCNAEIRVNNQATTLTCKFGKHVVLRVSLDAVLFGGRVIWQRTDFASS